MRAPNRIDTRRLIQIKCYYYNCKFVFVVVFSFVLFFFLKIINIHSHIVFFYRLEIPESKRRESIARERDGSESRKWSCTRWPRHTLILRYSCGTLTAATLSFQMWLLLVDSQSNNSGNIQAILITVTFYYSMVFGVHQFTFNVEHFFPRPLLSIAIRFKTLSNTLATDLATHINTHCRTIERYVLCWMIAIR